MWPDDPKSFKNFSSWENWPSPTGHAPSLAVLDRLARLYECDAAAGRSSSLPPAALGTAPSPAELVSHWESCYTSAYR